MKIIISIILTVLCFSCNKTNNKIVKIDKDNITTEGVERITPDSTSIKGDKLDSTIEGNTHSYANAAIPSKEDYHYHIIAASYANKAIATRYKEELSAKGYPSMVVSSDGRHRVSMYSVSTKAEALKELKRLKTINKEINLWILFN